MPLWPSREACWTYRFENVLGRSRSRRARVTFVWEVEMSAAQATTATAAPASQGASCLSEMFLIRFTSAARHVPPAQGDVRPGERYGAPRGRAEQAQLERPVEA